jgi:GT2 family glycosyltransferase
MVDTMTSGISFVVATRDRLDFLRATVESIRADAMTIDYEIVAVDGGSVDGSRAWLESERGIRLIRQEEEFAPEISARPSWGAFMNIGFRAAQFPYIFMLSDDCLLQPGSVKACMEILGGHTPRLGGIAVPWRNWPEDDEYRLGRTFGNLRFINHGIYVREALEDVGWIDEDAFAFYHADGDLSIRLQRGGWEIVDCEDAAVDHFMHANVRLRRSNNSRQAQDWITYADRWGSLGKPVKDWDVISALGEPSNALPFEHWGKRRALRLRTRVRASLVQRSIPRRCRRG